MSQFAKEYNQFFESPAGVQFLTFITNAIDTEHEQAEAHPDKAAFHASTAKAYRSVANHIKTVTVERQPEAVVKQEQ